MKKLFPFVLILMVFPALRADSASILFGRTQQAIQTPFEPGRNPDFNGGLSTFTSEDVQNAIEEAYHTAPGKARATIQIISNGTVGGGEWLGYSELLPCNDTPIPIPWPSTIKEITYSFDGSSVDGDFELYKNGFMGGDVVYTFNFSNVTGPTIDTVNIVLTSGDFICGRWVDNGQNPNDMAVALFVILN